MSEAWVGVDLDGTLAFYGGWKGEKHIGEPIPAMVALVRSLLESGVRVKIFTARVAEGKNKDGLPRDIPGVVKAIQDWTEEHVGARLEVTNIKDFGMLVLYDDRAVQVKHNTGMIVA